MTYTINCGSIEQKKQIITAKDIFYTIYNSFYINLILQNRYIDNNIINCTRNANLAIECNAKSFFKTKKKILVTICFLSKCEDIGGVEANKTKGIKVLYIETG